MEQVYQMLLETAAKNFESVSDMDAGDLLKGDGLRAIATGMVQFSRATKHSLKDPSKEMLAETAAKNFEAIGDMYNADIVKGDGLRTLALGLKQLARAMKAL